MPQLHSVFDQGKRRDVIAAVRSGDTSDFFKRRAPQPEAIASGAHTGAASTGPVTGDSGNPAHFEGTGKYEGLLRLGVEQRVGPYDVIYSGEHNGTGLVEICRNDTVVERVVCPAAKEQKISSDTDGLTIKMTVHSCDSAKATVSVSVEQMFAEND